MFDDLKTGFEGLKGDLLAEAKVLEQRVFLGLLLSGVISGVLVGVAVLLRKGR